jgi:glycosyltransferase involved in cell wall biosynthesis
MFKEYRRQSARLDLLRKYKAVIVHSGHMRAEFENNGLDPTLLFDLLYYVGQVNYGGVGKQGMDRPENAAIINAAERQRSSNLATAARLLFLGRMEHLKGGAVFLDSLAQVRTSLNRPLNVTFAGDGPARQTWERQARRVEAINEEIQINFAGWKQGAELEAIYANTDLLVVPSLWPEPFGLVGPEAGLRGIPVAAFGVGGIEDWLEDGVNGYLAAGPRQTAAALAESIIKCLIDIDCYAHLRQGAIEMASRFRIENHLRALLPVLENVSRQNPIAS